MEDDDLLPDLLRLVAQDKKQILPYDEVTEAINLETKEEKREVKIGTTLSPTIREKLIDLLREYSDVFAWYTKTCQVSTQISWYIVCL